MRLSLSSLALLLLPALAAAQGGPDLKPRPGEIFPPLLADPRQVQLSASFYRHRGRNATDLALGRSWGLHRWRSGEDRSFLWEADVEGMSYSRFRVESGRGELDTVDFFGALPVTVRRGDAAFKGSLFVENSHLGDDYIRRHGAVGYRYSTVGLRLLASLDPAPWLRVYGGGSHYLQTAPARERLALQLGGEAVGPDLRLLPKAPMRPFAALDLQPRERVGWNADLRLVGGMKFGDPALGRVVRVQAGYFTGHSPFHQFYAERDHYADLSVVLEL